MKHKTGRQSVRLLDEYSSILGMFPPVASIDRVTCVCLDQVCHQEPNLAGLLLTQCSVDTVYCVHSAVLNVFNVHTVQCLLC